MLNLEEHLKFEFWIWRKLSVCKIKHLGEMVEHSIVIPYCISLLDKKIFNWKRLNNCTINPLLKIKLSTFVFCYLEFKNGSSSMSQK